MRLWHQQLIPLLPRRQLLGQHRECCALRGNSWGKKHATVDYVFRYSPVRLWLFHCLVMDEMLNRGYNVDLKWADINYRGVNAQPYAFTEKIIVPAKASIYPEHDDRYLQECISNLEGKKIGGEYLQAMYELLLKP